MKHFYLLVILLTLFIPSFLAAQNCGSLTATFSTSESRCAATGSIKVTATGGSGAYKYRVSGPVNLNFTTEDLITGLPAGAYNVEVVDLNTTCQFTGYSIQVGGNYADPRFILNTTDITCMGSDNGTITVDGLQYGRQPFTFSIIAPSAMGVGTSNATGVFAGLKAGNYTIQLRDSCGGIQTRSAFINDYSWYMEGHSIVRTSCNNASGTIKVKDSRGRYSYSGGGIPDMQYGILKAVGDTIWSANANISFDATGMTSTKAFAKDGCGNVKEVSVDLSINPTVGAVVAVDQRTCNTFRATVQSVKMYAPSFQIFDKDNVLVGSNTTGVFPGLAYGTYTIVATDGCTGISISRTVFATAPVVSLDANVKISARNCNTFTATVTGQTNATNPTYKIFDEANVIKGNNATGIFQFLTYGKYRIEMKDGCIDTTIYRYIDVKKAVIKVDSLVPAYIKCNKFGIAVSGDSIYSGADYCLYDNLGTLIACNNTGKFDSLALGAYCVTIHDICRDTTITRCINVAGSVLPNDLTIKTDIYCNSFTATVQTNNFKGGTYILYKDNVVIATSTTGVFSTIAFGDYCATAEDACGNVSDKVCFSGAPLKPTGSAYLSASNQRCDKFDIQVAGVYNLTSPVYTFKDDAGTTVYTGSNSKVTDLPYGNYCVEIKDNCYDTTIALCKNVTAPASSASATFYQSCTYGKTRMYVNATVFPVTVIVKDPSAVMVASKVLSAPGYIEDIPGLDDGEVYTIEFEWTCGQKLTTTGTPVVGFLNHSVTVEQFCPGSTWLKGFGNIKANVSTNTGYLNVRIIKKDGNSVSLSPNNTYSTFYEFNNMEPATYVLRYYSNDGCNADYYDTVTIKPYSYPEMTNTTAFQCDNTGFSVSAFVSNGVGPYTYEIMSSLPTTPSIVTAPQASPVFTIDNGVKYELIRLRAIDACGNATLGDASILPLANNQIKGTTDNCIGSRVTLSIDTMINSIVTWTYKQKKTDVTENFLGNGFAYEINPLSYADTGYYYCYVAMNDGCILRTYEFNLNGTCYGVLADVKVDLKGKAQEDKSLLEWTLQNDHEIETMVVERSQGSDFVQIGKVNTLVGQTSGLFRFTDDNPGTDNQYRVKIVFRDGRSVYSKIVRINMSAMGQISVYPNPAVDYVNVELNVPDNHSWVIELFNVAGQKTVLSENFTGQKYTIRRNASIVDGVYILKVTSKKTGETRNYKVIFKK